MYFIPYLLYAFVKGCNRGSQKDSPSSLADTVHKTLSKHHHALSYPRNISHTSNRSQHLQSKTKAMFKGDKQARLTTILASVLSVLNAQLLYISYAGNLDLHGTDVIRYVSPGMDLGNGGGLSVSLSGRCWEEGRRAGCGDLGLRGLG